MPTRPRPRPALIWAALLILYVVWGSTYIGIRVAVETIPPFFMAASRFALAGAVMLGVAVIRARGTITLPSRREWRDSFIVGAFLMGGGMGTVALGERTVPSGIAALLIAMMPVWVAVLGRFFLGERLPPIAMLGIVVGLVGVGILVGPSGTAGDRLDTGGIAALIISPISWATGSLFSANRARLPRDPLIATGAQMFAGGLILATMAAVTGEFGHLRLEAISGASIAAFFYLALVGSLIAFTAYVWLLRVAPLPLIATYAYVNPVVAVGLGALILGEEITPRRLIAGGVIVLAVALIITARSRFSRVSGRRPEASPPARPAASDTPQDKAAPEAAA